MMRIAAAVPLMALLILLAGPPAAGADGSAEFTEIDWDILISESVRNVKPFAENGLDQYSGQDPAADQTLAAYLEKRRRAPANMALDRRPIKIRGFVVPLEWNAEAALTEFLLVPYFGACIHVPPPPLNQIIYVQPATPQKLRAMDVVAVRGLIRVEETSSAAGSAAYSLKAAGVESGGPPRASYFAYAFGLTACCGLSLCLGLACTRAVGRGNARLFSLALSFSAGIMTALGLSIVLVNFSWPAVTAFAIGGLAAAWLKYRFHENSGAPAHPPALEPAGPSPLLVSPSARNPGKFVALAIAAHNIPECFAVFSASMANPSLGFALGCAMISHNIPLGFSFALPGASGRWRYALAAGTAPVLAAVLLYLSARSLLSPGNLNLLFSFVGGLLVFIAVREVMPSARQYGGRARVAPGYCAGILFMIAMVFIFQ